MSINPNLSNREVCDLVFVDYKTKKPKLRIDYANVTTVDVTGETVMSYGGKKRMPRASFDGDRKGTLKIETQVQPFELYSLLTGANIETTAEFITREEASTTTASPTITLKDTPATGTTVNVFESTDDCGTPVPATIAGTTVTLTTPKEGNYIVYYMKAISTNVKKITIKDTTFPGYYTVYADTVDVSEDGEVIPYNMIVHKCKPQPNFSFNAANSGDPSTLTITCDMLADGKKDMLTMMVIEEDQNV